MPTYHKHENIWNVFDRSSLFLITTNASITREGRLVMGAGIAGQACERFPTLPEIWGQKIRSLPQYRGDDTLYGILLPLKTHSLPDTLGAFQTKGPWWERARLDLISYAVAQLASYARYVLEEHDYIALNFPGIGKGKLARNMVLPWVDLLPDNVHVFER